MRYYYPCKPNEISANSRYFEQLDNDVRWIAEVKKNGWRCLADKEAGSFVLWTRHKTFIVDPLKDLRSALLSMLPNNTRIDGELINNRTKDVKGIYYVFDILVYKGETLFNLPLRERREILEGAIKPLPFIELAQQFTTGKKELYSKAILNEVNEGIVMKKLDSRYLASQTRCPQNPYWLKVKRPEKHIYTKKGGTT
jgi:bifunctional non-homologous end joining protein LigD